jgi:hypothetical protein
MQCISDKIVGAMTLTNMTPSLKNVNFEYFQLDASRLMMDRIIFLGTGN